MTSGNSILQSTNGRGWGVAAHLRMSALHSPARSALGRVSMARWEALLPETFREAGEVRAPGPIQVAIFGYSAAMVTMRTALAAFSMTCGSSILQQANGPGWGETTRISATAAMQVCTERWGCRQPPTRQEAEDLPLPGSIRTAMLGFSEGMASTQWEQLVFRTASGSFRHRQPHPPSAWRPGPTLQSKQ